MSLNLAFDRLSMAVDAVQFERLRWARTEGPMLARLVALAMAAIEERSDFDLIEEGTSRDEKRFVLKIHGNRIVALTLSLDGDHALARVEAIERGRYKVLDGDPVRIAYASVDEAWMKTALEALLARIEPI